MQIGSTLYGLGYGDSHTFTGSLNPLNSSPGTWYLRIEDNNGIVHCSKTVIVSAPATCVNWTGNPPTGEVFDATEYLCDNGIINNNQNSTTNENQAILRQDIAKITYLGLYKDATAGQMNSPAKNFPVPFLDMQNQFSGNEYWFDAAKVLAYLQYSDDRTPFDRDFLSFKPTNSIERRYAIKLFLEAFNIPPSNSTTNPFSDVDVNDDMFKWIKKAHELGLITGNSNNCSGGTCFHPYDPLKRRDAFVILYRILTTTNINKPTISQLNNINNYYVPGVYTLSSMTNIPGLGQGNFNHYQKTSFSFAGRSSIPLDFTHTYNSFLTELPKGFFEEDDDASSQKFIPLGMGWTHTYNIYGVKVNGYTNGSYTEPDKIMFYYPDGSMTAFNFNTGQPIDNSYGVYDEMTKTSIAGGHRIVIKTKDQIKYTFENYNNGKFFFIKSITDRNDNGVKVNWTAYPNNNSSKYRISTVQEMFYNNSTGRTLTFNYTNSLLPYLSSVVDNSINRTITFNVSAAYKNLISFTDAKGGVTNYSYGSNNDFLTKHLLTQIQLPKGNKITNTYEQRKLTSSKTFSQNNVVTSTINVDWTPQYTTGTNYNSTGIVTDPIGNTTTTQFNSIGDATSISSPETTASITYASGVNSHLPTSVTENGQTVNMTYDNRGNLLTVSKNGITNTYTYNTKNDVTSHKDGKNYTTNYSYDNKGNLTQISRPGNGGNINISRNDYGQATSVTNPSGITTNYSYNANGLVNQVSMPLGITTSATYDNASRLLSTTDANNKITTYQYDANDNLTQSTDANGGIVQHTYDANDNHLTIKNPKNETQTNTYNFDDDMLASESFGPHTKSYSYNADGSLASFTRGNGTFNYTYDNLGRMTNDGQTQYAYDSRNRITSITNTNGTLTLNYDNLDRMTSYSDYFGNTVSYTYDANNNVTKITYPGNKQVNYVYDANNRCTSITDWNGKTTTYTYTYLTDDRISQITLPNGTKAVYTYDAAGRPTGISNKKANNTVISEYSFTLDNGGNHTGEVINEPSFAAALQNITAGTTNYGNYPYNRMSSQGSTSVTHNTAGAITNKTPNSYTYDLNDNLLTVSGAMTAQFKYDGAGNRREKTVNGTNTRYVLDILGMSQVLMETNASNAAQYYYVYGPSGLLYRTKASNNTNQYYHYDYRGSTTAITNESQVVTHSYSYDPFGKVLASTEADFNPYRYVGQHGVAYESDNLVFMRARYYDPSMGRFISEDPIWHLNLYPYADNNPIMMIDYDGKMGKEAWSKISSQIDIFHSLLGEIIKRKGLKKEADIYGHMTDFMIEFINQALIWSDKTLNKKEKAIASSLSLANTGVSSYIAKAVSSKAFGVASAKAYLITKGVESAIMDNYYGIRYGYNSNQFYNNRSNVSGGYDMLINYIASGQYKTLLSDIIKVYFKK